MTTDEKIQKHFRMRMRNLPYYPRKGTRNDLAELFEQLGFSLGAEIGVGHGVFSKILLRNPSLHLHCIDPWMAYHGAPQERMDNRYVYTCNNLKGLNAEIVRKTSMEAVQCYPSGYFDFVYVDGNHDFDHVMMDIIMWTPKVKSSGIFAAHDYHTQVGADVIAAIDAYTRCHFINPWYVTREELPTAFWVVK